MKKNKVQIVESSTDEKERPRKTYRDRLTILKGCGKEVPEAFMEEIAEDLEDWVVRTQAIRFKDFLFEHRLIPDTFYDMVVKCPRLKEAYDYALNNIASRRERGAIEKKYDTNAAYKLMSLYDHDYLRVLKEEAEIRKIGQGEGATANTFNVYLEPIPESPMVPRLKDNDE